MIAPIKFMSIDEQEDPNIDNIIDEVKKYDFTLEKLYSDKINCDKPEDLSSILKKINNMEIANYYNTLPPDKKLYWKLFNNKKTAIENNVKSNDYNIDIVVFEETNDEKYTLKDDKKKFNILGFKLHDAIDYIEDNNNLLLFQLFK